MTSLVSLHFTVFLWPKCNFLTLVFIYTCMFLYKLHLCICLIDRKYKHFIIYHGLLRAVDIHRSDYRAHDILFYYSIAAYMYISIQNA